MDKRGKLRFWSQVCEPSGETVDELIHDLQYMTEDVSIWQPVEYDSLKVGMTFERIVEVEN